MSARYLPQERTRHERLHQSPPFFLMLNENVATHNVVIRNDMRMFDQCQAPFCFLPLASPTGVRYNYIKSF
jgi:hypothetical protein